MAKKYTRDEFFKEEDLEEKPLKHLGTCRICGQDSVNLYVTKTAHASMWWHDCVHNYYWALCDNEECKAYMGPDFPQNEKEESQMLELIGENNLFI